jgi:hypothetical protein
MPRKQHDRVAPDLPEQSIAPVLRGRRRLIAGLRVSDQDVQLLALVAPFFPEVDSAGDLAYRLWRRGLELALAESVGLGAALPPGMTEGQIANLVAQRLALCLPLLRRTGRLALLGVEAPSGELPSIPPAAAASLDEVIDNGAADAITSMGGSDFL